MRVRLLVVVAILLAVACQRKEQDIRGGASGDVRLPQNQAVLGNATDTTGLPAEGVLSRVAIGDLAGVGNNTLDVTVTSPFARDMAAIKEGNDRFVDMNCAACHGYDLKGGMGPDLTDTYWRYGGAPRQ
jgi:hypothetical protein